MLYPIKVFDIELNDPVNSLTGLEGYMGVQILVRLHGRPVGYVTTPVIDGYVDADVLERLIFANTINTITVTALQNGLTSRKKFKEFCLEDLCNIKPSLPEENFPVVTVAVCTRNRTKDLDKCLKAISELDYFNLDLLVIDNAPGDDSTQKLLKNHYPHIRYVKEPRPGLDWARNRAIMEARGEIIAYTDDDVMVDKRWINELTVLFTENPEVMAVTGLVVPHELETKSQVLFETYGGFGKGFERKWYRKSAKKLPWALLGAGRFGTGANMSFRRSVFDEIGYFDPALDVGTATNGGGDLEIFFRILKEGHTLVYEPGAFVRHLHRRNCAELRYQITNNSKGFLSYCVRSIKAYPDEFFSFIKLLSWWVRHWILRRLKITYTGKSKIPRDLIIAEIQGCFNSFFLYSKARKSSNKIRKSFPSEPEAKPDHPKINQKCSTISKKESTGIRLINLDLPVEKLNDITDYANIRLFVKRDKWLLGNIDIFNDYRPVSKSRLIQTIAQYYGLQLVNSSCNKNENIHSREALTALQHRYSIVDGTKNYFHPLSAHITVSVVVATYDRPGDLRQCLQHLINQISPRIIQIIVVDNNPASGLTAKVVSEFPQVTLINETRKGLSYARNAGIIYSAGDIILTTDDDVTVPTEWVENTVAPFSRDDVMAVTGNVLPIELETEAQHLFEKYGGLGRGFKRIEANRKWFDSFRRRAVPTWKLGACANAAFRATIFKHPQIGIFNETLGAGTPTGCSEDSYLLYKILKANYVIIYEPTSFVWHKHRQSISSFRRQIYNYSKGHIAHHLITLIRDKDLRALFRIIVELPITYFNRIKRNLLGRNSYPISMVLLEIAGNFAGPWALFNSWLRVKRLGRSTPYISPEERTSSLTKNLLDQTKEFTRASDIK
ncbi:MAG: glycosyltransferase family 2 protein [Ginsengibacter sp.]